MLLLILILGFMFFLVKNFLKLYHLSGLSFRGTDAWGSGDFGASRNGHHHQGLDLKVYGGMPIRAPFSGKIRVGYPYNDTAFYKLVEISDNIRKVKIMYVKPNLSNGDRVKKGDIIGYAQEINKRYSSSMINHIHVEYRILGRLVNPALYIV